MGVELLCRSTFLSFPLRPAPNELLHRLAPQGLIDHPSPREATAALAYPAYMHSSIPHSCSIRTRDSAYIRLKANLGQEQDSDET